MTHQTTATKRRRFDYEVEHDGNRIVEGVMHYWHFHIAPANRHEKSYCGATTFKTASPWSHWGSPGPGHMPAFRYCKECEKHR